MREVYLQGTNHFGGDHPHFPPLTVGETANRRAFQGWEQGSLLNSKGHLLCLLTSFCCLVLLTPFDWTVTGPQGGRDTCVQKKKILLISSEFSGAEANKNIDEIRPPARETNHQKWLKEQKGWKGWVVKKLLLTKWYNFSSQRQMEWLLKVEVWFEGREPCILITLFVVGEDTAPAVWELLLKFNFESFSLLWSGPQGSALTLSKVSPNGS